MGAVEGSIAIVFGLFTICAAALDWEWFMNHRKARFLIGFIGRPGARVFYTLLGLVLIVGGGLAIGGMVPRAR